MEKNEECCSRKNCGPDDWKCWGSWFSFGSPIGMSLGFGIFLSSIGFFLLLLHWAGVIGK